VSAKDTRPASARAMSRRDLLRGGVVGLVVLAGCSKKGSDAFTCADTSGMEPEALEARTVIGYVDKAPDATKTCGACQQFVPSPSDGSCGSCRVVKGPIHPNGYCKAFTPKA
jgi:hypothetical protein